MERWHHSHVCRHELRRDQSCEVEKYQCSIFLLPLFLLLGMYISPAGSLPTVFTHPPAQNFALSSTTAQSHRHAIRLYANLSGSSQSNPSRHGAERSRGIGKTWSTITRNASRVEFRVGDTADAAFPGWALAFGHHADGLVIVELIPGTNL